MRPAESASNKKIAPTSTAVNTSEQNNSNKVRNALKDDGTQITLEDLAKIAEEA